MIAQSVDLRAVARWQRTLLWFVLGLLLLNGLSVAPIAAPAWVAGAWLIASIVVQVSAIVCVLQLQVGLRIGVGARILTGVLMFAPCINLLVLLSVNARATHALKKAGLKVGLLGVNPAEAERVLSPELCSACGYQLAGNVTGACPECGEPTSP